jgi:Zn-dependent alcohol dehydrogenase
MMGLSFAQAMFQQKISVVDMSRAARAAALANGADAAYDPAEGDIVKRIVKETEGDLTGSSILPAATDRWLLRSLRWRAAARSWSQA